MMIEEEFQVAVLIEKLFPYGKKYRNTLKYDKASLSLDEMITHINVEENNLMKHQIDLAHVFATTANSVNTLPVCIF